MAKHLQLAEWFLDPALVVHRERISDEYATNWPTLKFYLSSQRLRQGDSTLEIFALVQQTNDDSLFVVWLETGLDHDHWNGHNTERLPNPTEVVGYYLLPGLYLLRVSEERIIR